jgi:hypothetical protein
MGTLALLVFFMLLAKKGEKAGTAVVAPPGTPSAAVPAQRAAQQAQASATALQTQAKAQAAAARTPPAWPQVVPAGLPPFPSGWTANWSPPQAVVTRAWQLLNQLWASGSGTKKFEQTAGRWIAYVASPMAGGKRGVVAYTPKQHA